MHARCTSPFAAVYVSLSLLVLFYVCFLCVYIHNTLYTQRAKLRWECVWKCVWLVWLYTPVMLYNYITMIPVCFSDAYMRYREKCTFTRKDSVWRRVSFFFMDVYTLLIFFCQFLWSDWCWVLNFLNILSDAVVGKIRR